MYRNYSYDNMKFFLIFLVVFAHFLELIHGEIANDIYRIIYLFHMPAFVFVNGVFAKFNPRKIIVSLMIPYVFFQIIYLLFNAYVILGNNMVSIQMTTPFWLLWYILAVIFYYVLIPFFETSNVRKQNLLVGLSVVISLLAGYEETIGYYLSLSRFFTFLPFFIMGYYFAKRNKCFDFLSKKESSKIITVATMVGGVLSIVYILKNPIHHKVLYGSYSYVSGDYNPIIKFLLLIFSICWIVILKKVIPNKKIPCVSTIGKNTFSIYIVHGFVVKLAQKYDIYKYNEFQNIMLAILITIVILILFGNDCVCRVIKCNLFKNNKNVV